MSEYGETYRHVNGKVISAAKVFNTVKGDLVKFTVVEQDGFGTKNDATGEWTDSPSRFYDVAVWNEGLQKFALSELYKEVKVAVEGRFSVNVYEGKERPQIMADQIGIVQYGTRTKKGEKAQETAAAPGLDF